MEFLYPNVLYGLFVVAIPILVHLFNFRRYKKVYFSNVAMLQSIHKKTRKQSEIKHLVVLLSRILAIIAIVLAFAQPFIPNNKSQIDHQKRKLVSIYIDNSFSMTHIGENGSLFNEAQNMALHILDSYQNSDYFHLITNDMYGKHHRWFNKAEMAQNVMEIQADHLQQSFHDIFQREQMLREQSGFQQSHQKAILYLLSDFQKNNRLDQSLSSDTNLLVRILPLQNNPVNNISIDSCWFEYPVQLPHSVSELHVKLSNRGSEDLSNIPLKLLINNEQKTLVAVHFKPNESQIVDLSFTNGEKGDFYGELEIDDYPIVFDDHLYFNFRVRDLFHVSMIYQENPNVYLRHLFSRDSLINWSASSVNAVAYEALKNQDLIILNELKDISSGLKTELEQYTQNGGQLLIIPNAQDQQKVLNSWMQHMKAPLYSSLDTNVTRLGDIDKQQSFFRRVFEKGLLKREQNQKTDLPLIWKYYPIQIGTQNHTNKLLTTRGKKNVLTMTKYGSGQIFQLAMPLNTTFSQLPEHAIFVPIFYQMVLQMQNQKAIYESIGSNRAVEVNLNKATADYSSDEVPHLQQKTIDWIPEIKNRGGNKLLMVNIQWPNDGVFKLRYHDQVIDQIAVNYDRKESNFSNWTPEDLLQQIADNQLSNFQVLESTPDHVSSQIVQLDQGKSLWKWFVIIAFLMLIIETGLLRWWK